MRFVYPCVLTPEEGGGYAVSFPDVPEALTGGNDRADALAMAADALTVSLGAYIAAREDVPVPSVPLPGHELVAVPSALAAKLAQYTALRDHGITREALHR